MTDTGRRHGTFEEGDNGSMLQGLHGEMCGSNGKTFSAMRPAPTPEGFVVIFMEWCSDCGACAWEVV